MTLRPAHLVALTAAIAVFVPGAQNAVGQNEPPTLIGTVGPAPQITLTTADGKPVTTLVEGTYTFHISDKSANHNFHLFGPDLNQTTTVPEVTDTTWTVTLKPGGYAFVCDPHQALGMRGTFSVVAATRLAAPLDTKQVVGHTSGKRATGSFTGTLRSDAGGNALDWQLTFRRLTGAAVAAHIHTGRPGSSGGILIPLCAPCRTGQTGTATVPAAAMQAIMTGATYVNVHTKKNPGGEIRGQLTVQG
jgi:CHRD domain/Copper binding proteins, plastocyanin/azurin family